MKLKQTWKTRRQRKQSAYTLAEVAVAAGLLGFMVVSLFAGFTSGFAVVRLARENLRSTQIMEERMELIRLVNWKDVQTPGFVPTTFTAPFDATNTNSLSGFVYQGTVSITNAPMSETYATNLVMVRIDLTWKSANVDRHRQMTTYVSKFGLQNYVY
ncbi:MAG: type II secretion system protein [Verrucomicrobia bacterium]|nr:MAG: type II secretion system protein [Verrucomicrobiota bacterium]